MENKYTIYTPYTMRIYVRRCSSIGLRGGISVHGIAGPDKHVVRTVVDTELIDGAALQTQGQKLPSPGGWIHLVAENVTYLHPCHVTPIQDQTNLPRRCPDEFAIRELPVPLFSSIFSDQERRISLCF